MSKIDDLIVEHCPDGVPFERLRDVGTWYGGGTPSKAVREFWENGSVPWLSPKDMDVETVAATGLSITEVALERSPLKLVPAGSVAFVMRSNVLRRRLPIAFVPFDVTLNQDMRAVVPRPGILPEYVLQACRARANVILSTTGRTDGSMAAINSHAFLDFRLPVPPAAVQAEIVRVVQKLGVLHAELESQLAAELDLRSRQSAFYRDELLTCREAGDARWVPMGEAGEFIRGRRFTKNDIVDEGVACINFGEIYTHYGVFAHDALSRVRKDLAPSLRFATPGDVVVTAVSETVEDIGKAVAWLGEEDVAVHDDCFFYRHTLNAKFVSYFMQTSMFRSEKARHVDRGKVKRISGESLAKLTIPVPSEEEQGRIVGILDKLDALVNDLSVGLAIEIEARRQQYEHYRDRLLTFDETLA